jgi:hypothetical protein
MNSLKQMKSDGLVLRLTPEAWGAFTVIAGAIAAFVVLAIIRS